MLPLWEQAARQAEAFARPYLDNLVRRRLAQAEPGGEEYFEAAPAASAAGPGVLKVARTPGWNAPRPGCAPPG
ncbi:hypothetical protein [Actinoplanes sp. RD1]|uniref:hypothetical protein n=1 Tax=Actinoplanes sp. RD1 TaxID=3064538 RepID=UPI0027408D46|nr:hypothetical protein [Actinoplanes sp. RD1]